jgi:hypothetical protein
MGAFLNYYILFTTVITVLAIWYLMYRFTTPLKCTCGYSTIFVGRFKRHILQGHKWS